MCGRYQLDYDIEQLMLQFDAENRYLGYGAKIEIFPTDVVAIITRQGQQNYIDAAKWGFKNPYDNRPLINARGETVDEKKTFKSMFGHSRCIIPASAFFEWKKNPDGGKSKTKIAVSDSPIFGMAGLYRAEQDEKGDKILRCAIITTAASPAMSEIHDRMPVILPAEAAGIWLNPDFGDTLILKELLKPFEGNIECTVVA